MNVLNLTHVISPSALRRVSFTLAATLASLTLIAQESARPAGGGGGQGPRDYSKVEIKTTPVAGNIYLLEGAGGNTGVSVGPDGILIVDDQFLPMAEKIDAALAKLSTNSLKYVINTHVHGDHTGGNSYFGKKATIVAHKNLAKRLAEKKDSKPEEIPVITYDSGLSLKFNGEEVKLIGLPPGHTDGDSVVYFTQSKVVQFGDQFVNGRFPFVDLANGGDIRGFVKNLSSVLEWLPEDAKVIPGHGVVSTTQELRKLRDTVAETVTIVEKDIAAGKTLDQIKAENPLAQLKGWSSGFANPPRWLEAVYNSLTKKS